MARKSKVAMELKKMQDLLTVLSHQVTVSVGVRADMEGRGVEAVATSTQGLTNSDLGMIHEYGSPQHHIPARSILNVPIHDHKDEILKPFKGKAEAFLNKGSLNKMYDLMGAAGLAVVLEAFKTGGFGKWAPLSYKTLLAKLNRGKDGKDIHWRKLTISHIYAGQIGMGILIDSGQLRRSFGWEVKMEKKGGPKK